MSSEVNHLVVVARIGRPHGVRGEMRVWPFDSESGSLFDVEDVFIGASRAEAAGSKARRVRSARATNKCLLLSLDGVADRDEAADLNGKQVFVRKADLPPLDDPDEFYYFELVGLDVSSSQGEPLGTLEAIWDTGGGDVLVIRDREADTEVLVPFVQEFVEFDEDTGCIVVDPPEGLIEATRTSIGEAEPDHSRRKRRRGKGKKARGKKKGKGPTQTRREES